ncbi:MAG: septum formation initiator family protein [Candidatus Cryosericum sp.]
MHKVLALVACFVIGYLIWSTVAALAYLGKADQLVTSTFAELQRVSAQTLEQQKAMQYHTTNAYIEKVAREDMLMSKKGDTVILFPVDRTVPEPVPHEPTGLPGVLSQLITWLKRWF